MIAPAPSTAPTITSAAVQASGNAVNVAWTAVAGAEWYQLFIIQPPPAGPGGSALTVAARQVVGTSITGLPVPNGSASAIVAACTGNGCGPYSGVKTITASGANPSAPQLGHRSPDRSSTAPRVMFTWSRVPGDTGSNTSYRLYVQDLSRGSAALDVITTQNFYAAYLKGEGARYDALVVGRPGTAQEITGPAVGLHRARRHHRRRRRWSRRPTTAPSPAATSPSAGRRCRGRRCTSTTSRPCGDATYAPTRGVTPGLLVQVPLLALNGQPTLYSAISRACPAGATCASGSDAGWGPWSNVAGTGVINFTVTP